MTNKERRKNLRPYEEMPLFSSSYSHSEFSPEENSIYIYAKSIEERSEHVEELTVRANSIEYLAIQALEPLRFGFLFNGELKFSLLRSAKSLIDFWGPYKGRTVYLDITGLPHHIWAPLIRHGIREAGDLRIVYVEPDDYRFNIAPTEGRIHDLSESISGVAPIPGFVSLKEVRDEEICFVPLLGFEGTRLSYLIENVQPPNQKIVPIIGVPGFRVEYPFYAYMGNRASLSSTGSWKDVRFAPANCPFSIFYLLEEIASTYPNDLLKIAPIGTKPHALGAILYAIISTRPVEIVYDHPIRKSKRTSGVGRVFIYSISPLVN